MERETQVLAGRCREGVARPVQHGLSPLLRLGRKRGSWSGPQDCAISHHSTHQTKPRSTHVMCASADPGGCLPARTSSKAESTARVCAGQKPAYGPKETLLGRGRAGCAYMNHSPVTFALVSGPVAKAEGPIGPLVVLLFLLPAASVSLSGFWTQNS